MSITTSNRDINALMPLAREACMLFLDECKKQEVKVFITETYRSQERQDYLYAQGRTRPGKIVTSTKSSNHKNKLAFDIAVSPPKALYDSAEIAKAGKIAGSLGIQWGGQWKGFVDTPHFQIDKNWKNPQKSINKVVTNNNKTKFNLDGNIFELDGFIKDGKTYVITRDLLEGLGFTVGWNNNTKSVTIDGNAIDFEKVVIDGKTYAIARPLLEQLGFGVGWNENTKTVIVTK